MRKTNTYETFRNNSSGGTGATSQEFVFFEGALGIYVLFMLRLIVVLNLWAARNQLKKQCFWLLVNLGKLGHCCH